MLIQILIFLFLALTTTTQSTITRIIGGEDADIIDFPHVAAIITIENGFCECIGTIISNREILTAAHCMHKYINPIDEAKIQVGSSNVTSSTARVLHLDNIFYHPSFRIFQVDNVISYLNDVAVVKVHEYIEFNRFVNRVKLPNKNIQTGDSGFISGWGLTSLSPPTISLTLQKVWMRVFDGNYCLWITPLLIQPDQFCGYQKPGVGPCLGDSGSALVSDNTIIGIASSCVPCAMGFPDIYTNVFEHVDFIKNYISE